MQKQKRNIKILNQLVATFLVILTTFGLSAAPKTSAYEPNWHIYHGNSEEHSFSLRFPPGWSVFTSGPKEQSFSPTPNRNEAIFTITEHENADYQSVISSFLDNNTQFVESKDIILTLPGGDLPAKLVIYRNLEKELNFAKVILKRADTIFSMSHPNLEEGQNFPTPDYLNENIWPILASLTFEDGWKQHIDYENQFTFIYPKNLKFSELQKGVEIYNPGYTGGVLFSVKKYEANSLTSAARSAAKENEILESTKPIKVLGLENAIDATYLNLDEEKRLSKIFIEKDESIFSMNNLNREDNFPHFNYYDKYINKILESFEFLEVDTGAQPFKHFPDVRNDHPNSEAINYLKDNQLVNGYDDGNFRPDESVYGKGFIIILSGLDLNMSEYQLEELEPVSRKTAIKIIVENLLSEDLNTDQTLNKAMAADVNPGGKFVKYFITADNLTLLDKQHTRELSDGSYFYYPNKDITRKELAEILYRINNLKTLSEEIETNENI